MSKTKQAFAVDADYMLKLSQKYGTPLYVYDTSVMEKQYKRLKKAFSKLDTQINYACKALSNTNVLRFFHSLGAGLDTVSIEEVQLGLHSGFSPDQIIFTPNCVSFDEIRQAVELGVRINIDNLSILEQFGNTYGNSYPVCVRMNPHIMAGGNTKISTGHIDSKFGISIHQMRHLQRIAESYKLNINGLHMHTGSDILDVDVFINGANLLLDCALQFNDLEYIDFGSGFKVAYKPGDMETDVELLGERMTELMENFFVEYGRKLTIEFEPGKFLVSESGYFLADVNVIKQTTATVFAGINTGLNHFIRPMFYDAYHHITNLSNIGANERVYTVVGYICETDTFAWDRRISEIREGDILCFHNAGAYLYAMSSNYNSRLKPAEVLIHKGNDYLISRRQNFEDLLSTQIEIPLNN
ncbi:MAG: diaminopimelate decarboxylase [Flavobacteriales bacterium]|nr:MAG: diaminopimelate decarboxylase [Flavobacteriales bacterium]